MDRVISDLFRLWTIGESSKGQPKGKYGESYGPSMILDVRRLSDWVKKWRAMKAELRHLREWFCQPRKDNEGS